MTSSPSPDETPDRGPGHPPTDWPAVSVVIPVRNGAGSIGTAIESCLAQDYEGPIEVVVGDGRSTDTTRAVVESFQDMGVRLVDNPTGLTPAGLNAAIAAAHGDVIVRCDAHSRLPADYVRRAVEILDQTGADNVGGIQRAVGVSLVQRAIALAMTSRIGVGDARFHYGGSAGPTDTVYLGVFRREALDRVGLFDETLHRNQDYELNHRIRATGGVVFFHPDLAVEYAPRRTFRRLWSQYYQYGHWKLRVLRRHPRSLRLRQLAPPLLVVGLIGSGVLAVVGRPGYALVIPAAWLGALLAAGLVTVVRTREPAALLMPVAVGIMHLSWGLGFLGAAVRLLR